MASIPKYIRFRENFSTKKQSISGTALMKLSTIITFLQMLREELVEFIFQVCKTCQK